MEDSGFDSGDIKATDYDEKSMEYTDNHVSNVNGALLSRPPRSANHLQKKIEKRIEQARRNHSNTNGAIDQQPRKGLIPISRLHVPSRVVSNAKDDAEQPLVTWIADSSEDEYEFHPAVSNAITNKDISNQLQKDGFNLDLTPDDDDLDLIPPRPLKQNCTCCNWPSSLVCTIQ